MEGSPDTSTLIPQMRFGKIDDLKSRVIAAADAARKFLFSQQDEQGFWCGELEADTTLESDYILLHTLLGTGSAERMSKAARYVLKNQNDDGSHTFLPMAFRKGLPNAKIAAPAASPSPPSIIKNASLGIFS